MRYGLVIIHNFSVRLVSEFRCKVMSITLAVGKYGQANEYVSVCNYFYYIN
jgi:hypothetical protein